MDPRAGRSGDEGTVEATATEAQRTRKETAGDICAGAAPVTAFDTRKLAKEMVEAVEADERYRREDEAKKRAILTASDYDEFRNLVACSGQRPVTQRELATLGNVRDRPLNRFSAPSSVPRDRYGGGAGGGGRTEWRRRPVKSTDAAEVAAPKVASAPLVPPATCDDFVRHWRRPCLTAEDRVSYVRLTTPEAFPVLFATEMDCGLLLEIADVFQTVLGTPRDAVGNACLAAQTLCVVTSLPRFSLTVRFFSKSQHESMLSLLDVLVEHVGSHAVGCVVSLDDMTAARAAFVAARV